MLLRGAPSLLFDTFGCFSFFLLSIDFSCFMWYNAYARGVAQLGRALRSGRRGRKFESCHLDHKTEIDEISVFLLLLPYFLLFSSIWPIVSH